MPINHVGIAVPEAQLEETVQFYLKTLGPLGYVEMVRPVAGVVGMGTKGVADLWLSALLSDVINSKVHLAFDAEDRNLVKKCHEEALATGAKDNGPPGMREQYTPTYYACYVLDPLGNNVEIVTHAP
ncbi:MAG: hypothetical protein M1815_003342 [Lichina confinis]|nr:MAG: hypothetical protein M1815_003342 [Lichina confinis]